MTKVSILSQVQCELGEGPFYCERRDTLFWFDILARKRHSHCFADGVQKVQNLTEMTSAMASVDECHDVMFTSSGLWMSDCRTGAWSPVASIEADNALTRSNDARVHQSGAFWLGTMGRKAETGAGKIYRYFKGRLDVVYHDITIPNAICFSPDGRTAYWTDSAVNRLMAVAVDPDTGAPEGEARVLVDENGKAGAHDGAICDADGTIWNAKWGAAALMAYNGSGSLMKQIDVPAKQTSCPAFVGGGRIAVTSAWQGMNDAERAADSHAGKTFLVEAGVTPRFEPSVKL